MSIMTMFQNAFGTQPAAPVAPIQQSAPATPGNIPEQQSIQADPNNVNAPAMPAPEGLDQFNDLWKPVESPAGGAQQPMFNVDPKQLMDAAGKLDFTKVIAPANLQAIAQGGEGAMKAFSETMNKVAQTVYAQNAMATSKIVEQAVNRSREAMMSELPQHIKNQNVSDTLRLENPAFSHPAASPILGALQQQLSVKFPNASSSELSGMAKNYLEHFATAMKGPQAQSQNQTPAGEDWSKFLG